MKYDIKAEYGYYCWGQAANQLKAMPFWLYLIKWYWGSFRERVLTYYCKYKGHKWDVEAHISPDSGEETFTCRRCGEYHRIVYY